MKIICVGLNYQSHNKEMASTISKDDEVPAIFMKPDTALLSGNKPQFYIPDFTKDVHYEAEVVVKINKVGKNIAERFAHRYYDELTVGIDFTARDIQLQLKKQGMPWEIAKAFDNSAVLGKFISKEALGLDVTNLDFSLQLNEKEVQSANTNELIYSIDKLIAYISQYFTLKTGDLIFTGTPAGIGSVKIGDHLRGFLCQQELLDLEVC